MEVVVVIRRWLPRHKSLMFVFLLLAVVWGVVVLAFRVVSGRPLLGDQHPTDSTFLRPATRSLRDHVTYPSRWSMWPGWRRGAVRVSVLTVVVLTWWGYVVHPRAVVSLWCTGVVSGVVWGVRSARRVTYARAFRRQYVRPLAQALAPVLGCDPIRADSWLYVSEDLGDLTPRLAKGMSPAEIRVRQWYGEHVEPVVRWLPDRWRLGCWWVAALPLVARTREGLTRPKDVRPVCVEVRAGVWVDDVARKAVSAIVPAKLALGDLTGSWSAVGPQMIGRWTIAPQPPRSVCLADIREAIDAASETEIVLGLMAGGVPYTVDLDDDSPHIAVSAGTGAGKSVLAMLAAVQILRRGGRVVILDIKGSHRWARGVPGILYCLRPEEMHNALIDLAGEARARNLQAMVEDDGWTPDDRVLIIFEEMNATMAQLTQYWEETRGKGAPKTSPAVRAFREIMYMGRSAWVNLLAIAQMLTAQTAGGPSARENFGIRALSRYTRNNWKMMAPEAPMPRPTKIRGRWQIVVAGEVTAVQVAFLTTHEARELAAGRRPVPMSTSELAPSIDLRCPDTAAEIDGIDAGDLPAELTITEALDMGLIDGRRDAIVKRLQRDPAAPAELGRRGRARLYAREDLVRWAKS